MLARLKTHPTLWQILLPIRWLGRLALRVDPLFGANLLLRNSLLDVAGYARGTLVDVGCGGKPYEGLFAVDRHLGVDVPARGARPDVWGDALALPLADRSADTVLCNQVLEHVPEPLQVLRETHRVLRPGGYLLLTTPQTWGLHLVPHDYFRYTQFGLRHLAAQAGFEILRVDPTSGFWATATQRLSDVIYNTYATSWPWYVSAALLRIPCAVLVAGGLLLDRAFGKHGDTLDNVLVARKPA